MEITLESLGLTKKALQDRVIELAVGNLLSGTCYDEDGNIEQVDSKLRASLDKQIKERIDETIRIFGETNVLPNVTKYIENISLQKTSQWGEKEGKPFTFTEDLVSRAEKYMTEIVDSNGKSQEECRARGDSWYPKNQTRLAFMVDKYLYVTIENAMKQVLANANSQISKGLVDTVKMSLEGVINSLKVAVTIK
jgi:hypothetical protein